MCVPLASLVVFILDRTLRRRLVFVGSSALLNVWKVPILVREVSMLGRKHGFGFDGTQARIQ